MEFGPILRALLRNKLGVVLIALQIAFTMTVIVNAVYIINDRASRMARPSGIDEANTFHISSVGYGNNFNEAVVKDEDLSMIRRLPGVVDATIINAIPVSSSGSSMALLTDLSRRELMVPTATYSVDEHALTALGVNLVAGEAFNAGHVQQRTVTERRAVSDIILTVALAEALFPNEAMQAVGKVVYLIDETPVRILGIVERLQTPWPDVPFVENSVLLPEVIIDGGSLYLVRTEPGYRDELMVTVEEMLAASMHPRILRNNRSFEFTRGETYRVDTVMSTILTLVIATLMFITAMGIVGLAVFGINRRRKQIGTRRALGATRSHILRYFMLENLMISSAGVLLGAVLTLGFNIFLVQTFNMPPIHWYYAPAGMLALLILGQLAVIGPARNAAAIAPALATRSI